MTEEIIGRVALATSQQQADRNHGGEVGENDGDVERAHYAKGPR